MKTLNAREKLLANAVLIFALMFAWTWSRRTMGQRLDWLTKQVKATQDQAQHNRDLVNQTAAMATKPVSEGAKRLTAILLRDLSLPQESDRIRVVKVDRADTGFTIVLEGEFIEMMRFLSFLERKDGKFDVTKAEFMRIEPAENSGIPGREIRATFDLGSKGSS